MVVNLIFDEDGVCGACRVAEEFDRITPQFRKHREKIFRNLIENYRSKTERITIALSRSAAERTDTGRHIWQKMSTV
jgi:hypothetical protein